MPKKLSFHVFHVSGHDDDHSGHELEVHSPFTKGWQSPRFCIYPQEIVLMLKEPARLRKIQLLSHQYLIASKVEIFMGGSASSRLSEAISSKFRRLGYVTLADNATSGFKVRELKSIHLDAEGQFIKLLLHKNHVNKYNIYNQVNIIGVNIIGDPINKSKDESSKHHLGQDGVEDLIQQYLQTETVSELNPDPVLYGKINRPEYISPLDDLAFDMYQDPETAQLIRRLDDKKREAVLQERFDYAKKLKQAIADLRKVGEKLAKFEVEKRRAIELEDYDGAKTKKLQSDEYRLYVYKQLDLHSLLELNKATMESVSPPTKASPSPLPKVAERSQHGFTSPSLPKLDHKPSTTRYQASVEVEQNTTTISKKQVEHQFTTTESETVVQRLSPKPHGNYQSMSDPDDRPLPALKNNSNSIQEQTQESNISNQGENESENEQELSEKDEREAGPIIEVYGLALVKNLYSKSWKHRQEALTTVDTELHSTSSSLIGEQEPRQVLRATILVVKKTLKEQVFSIFSDTLKLLKFLIEDYVNQKQLGKSELTNLIDKVLPELLKRGGDTAARSRDAAMALILEIAVLKDVKVLAAVPEILLQPAKKKGQAPWRILKCKLELIQKLMEPLGVNQQAGFTTEGVMKVVVSGLDHNHKDVREAAINCLFELYKKVGERVKTFLPPDEASTRKNPLYSRIFDGFDTIDGKPTEAERKALAKKEKDIKKDEIAALQAQLQALRAAAATIGKETDTQSQAPTELTVRDEALNIERMCIFCGEQNENFNEETLDTHYWKSCPMLKRCDHCSQVVEIATLHEHLLSECDKKDLFTKCGRCKEAVLSTDYDEHIRAKACPMTKSDKATNRCILCRGIVPKGEEGWKKHLINECKANEKRLQQQQQGKVANSNKGQGTKSRGAVARKGRQSGVASRLSNLK